MQRKVNNYNFGELFINRIKEKLKGDDHTFFYI